MSSRWDVLGVGSLAVDDLLYVDGSPEPDTKCRVVDRRREGGGLVGTALVTVTRLGGTAAYVGVLGDDEMSRYSLDELVREGVDCSLTVHRPGARPIHSVIIVDRRSGHRTLLYDLDGVLPPDGADVTSSDVGACRVLLIDSTMPSVALHAIVLAKQAGIPTVADLEDATAPDVVEMIPEVDHLIVSQPFGAEVTGAADPADIVRALQQPGHEVCVVTAGSQGCWYWTRESGGRVAHQPALDVVAVDTTGCGDVFHGAYAASIARGDGVARAIAIATVAGSIKATHPGGRSGIPEWDEVERHLRNVLPPERADA